MVTIKLGLAAIAALGLAVSPAMAQTRSTDSLPSRSIMIDPGTGQCVEITRDPSSSTSSSVLVNQARCAAAKAAGSNGAGAASVAGTGFGFSPALLLALLAIIAAIVAAAGGGGGGNDSPG